MKILSIFLIALSLAACAPRAQPAPERVYQGSADAIYAEAVRVISTAQPIRFSNGWIITQSDRAGGFLAAQTSVQNLFSNDRTQEAISVVVSPKGAEQTAVVIQGTPGASYVTNFLAQRLNSMFGMVQAVSLQPEISQTELTPN